MHPAALRSLTHFRKASLAVALGAAVASTVLTGALLTGDSVRGSLRDLTLERLGGIDQALVSSRFFREELAADLKAAPLIVLRGTAVHGETGARAAGVAIYGIDARFAELHGTAIPELTRLTETGIFPPVVLNEPLQRELGVRPGDDVLLSFERPGEIPSETLLGEREPDDVLATRRFTVARVLPERGLGSFGLAAQQSQPRTAFVSLKDLQLAAERAGEVNALVTKEGREVRDSLQLEDLGLRLVRGERHVSLESEEFYLDPAVAQAIGGTPSNTPSNTPSTRIFTHLATGLRVGERLLPYSMVSGISSLDVGDGEILLNRWAADDLQARPGEPVEMSYLVMAPGGGLLEKKTTLRLRGVLEMSGLGADRSLTPTFPGIENAEDMSAWDPPFPVDLDVIRPHDEEYWDTWGAAPKAFVSLETARRLWSTRFGDLTAIRVPLEMEENLRRELPRKVPLEPFGLVFQPLKREGLAAAEGSTDFAGLFLAFSFFLILSAVLLVGLLFSLSVERRAGELGLLLAVGYPISKVRRRLLAEGAVLAGLGSLLGLAGAAGYAWLLMAGLRSWWLPAVGTPHLFLHVSPASLAMGWAASVATVLLAVAWTVRRLSKLPAPALLAGSTAMQAKGGRLARRLAPGAALVAAALLALSWKTSSPALWMGIGSSLLVCGLALVSLWLRRPRPARHLTLTGMAARNGAASPGRSLLSVALVACACFVLVTVAANRREAGDGEAEFPLYAESAVPVVVDPAEEAGLHGVTVHSLYTVPGDDISCLNLFRPTRPRLLGVPSTFAGFDALKQDLGPDVVPAVADANSATWILKLGIGDELSMEDESGRPVRIRLVGLLERSLFQSEVLISEAAMLRHFPGLARKTFFLIDGPLETAQALEEALSRYGFDVSTTAERLASYHAVEDTYLSTFQALGGFGLLLGTLGLGVALLRSLIERRGELATLRAFGFRRSRIAGMVVAENGFLLLLGVAVGTVSGLLAVAPHLGQGITRLPWAPLVATILAVVAVGLISCAAAVRSALKAPLLPVLKEER
ncbi:MAG TPA: ABC transporter permease [Thermoanaerobaculia bacterium]|jgi:ABC-type lipoprotein release transport system permease subunit|nr:ABC transporter permease [Thermoanaerobaculia bacterium]